jgi:hypothetical protein
VNDSIANDRPKSTPVHETPDADGQNAARSTLRPGSATGVVPSITLTAGDPIAMTTTATASSATIVTSRIASWVRVEARMSNRLISAMTTSPARENQYQAGSAPVSSATRLAVKNPKPHSTAPPSTRNAAA